ncbi:MAG: hypothetical protein KDD53_09880, partial [Bdellovibrionales bacterium]|nr:hypothetical protein [Bdellovibrionales bacterium]
YPVVFSTHPMDLEFANELASRIGGTVMSNTKYLSHDLQCIMRRCELFMGMRFHSVVLASAVYSPVIGLIYAPKVRGFMRLLECEEFGLELANLSKDSLSATLIKGWEQRSQLQEKQRKIIDELKAGAWQAARSLRETILPSSEGKFEAAAKAI